MCNCDIRFKGQFTLAISPIPLGLWERQAIAVGNAVRKQKRHDYSRGVQRKEERSSEVQTSSASRGVQGQEERSSEVQTSSARLVSELRVRPSLFRQGV